MNMLISPAVMVIGDAERAEMRAIAVWLTSTCQRFSNCVWVEKIDQALDKATAGSFPDLVIVLQSWSTEYSRDEVNRLLGFVPLARLVVCYGAWCESDGRNQSIWPQSVRIPLWSARSRIERELRLIIHPGEQAPVPWSASREEIFAADHPSVFESAEQQTFMVDSPDPAYRLSVVEIMKAAGHQLDNDLPDIILFDADPWGPQRATALKLIQDQLPNSNVIALCNLASPSMVEELKNGGVSDVLHKLGFRPL